MDNNQLTTPPINQQAGQAASQSARPVSDLSPRVVQLARMLDRLPPGNYEISLQKQELRAQDWNVEIVRTEKIATVQLPKYNPE